jgi:hypothetical protein
VTQYLAVEAIRQCDEWRSYEIWFLDIYFAWYLPVRRLHFSHFVLSLNRRLSAPETADERPVVPDCNVQG